jgi:prepilin-type N-terminal cleavage/methylation domain-containing protein/prepilin-type processing-associated H-X9-DG protein
LSLGARYCALSRKRIAMRQDFCARRVPLLACPAVPGWSGLAAGSSKFVLRHRNPQGNGTVRTANKLAVAPKRRGLTIVELVVVVAIIGVLVAVLLPAVHAAREASRRTSCQNNLRQIGIAAALHANARGSLPIGCIGGRQSPDKRCISWNVQLLPYLERAELWQAFDFAVGSYHAKNKPVREVLVEEFLCPSTQGVIEFSAKDAWKGAAFTDYGGIYGVEGIGRDREAGEPGKQMLKANSLGVMLYDEAVATAQIKDGLSKTVCFAEMTLRRTPAVVEWVNGLNIFAHEQSTPINGVGLENEIGSPHPGGALVVFCDAHVEFLSETMDQDVLNAMLTRSGREQ